MRYLPIFVLFVTFLVVKGFSESVLCYECDNCDDETLLKSCPPETTTPPPSTTRITMPPTTTPTSDSTATTEPTTESTSENKIVAAESVPSSVPSANGDSASILSRSSRELSYTALMMRSSVGDSVSYQCYSIVADDNGNQKTQKGCIEVPANKNGCDVLKEQFTVVNEQCKVCSESRCNSSGVVKICSLMTLAILVVISLFQYQME